MLIDGSAYSGKRVWISGHTGFKGSWLCEWLLQLGAEVWGYSLEPQPPPALFTQLELAGRIARHEINDVRNIAAVKKSLAACSPDYVFHLAAQPLVRFSYVEPVETYAVNVMGTIHVMEALRDLQRPCVAVMITTDKCYENREWLYGYREEDPLGGYDPYSSSKAAAEIAIAAYRRSFFSVAALLRKDANMPFVALASARAGNVIGGGDWALDRIVPDCMRALGRSEPIVVRNPTATRPWQHVLEPLSGYLLLAAQISSALGESPGEVRTARLQRLCGAFNFGPALEANRSVQDLVAEVLLSWPGGRWEDHSAPGALHEARLLNLTTDKAHHVLGWKPRWDFATGVRRTVEWYRFAMGHAASHVQIAEYTQRQIRAYQH